MDSAARGPHISVVTPVYRAEGTLLELYERLTLALAPITADYEIVMVNDASPDRAWEIIAALHQRDPRVVGINLARNFGQHFALTAGLDYARGDWVVVMDCDLQDRPEEIPKLYAKAREGFDVVFGRRSQRLDTFFKRLTSWFFSVLFGVLSGLRTDHTIANFSICRHDVVVQWRRLREHNRAYAAFLRWLGYPSTTVDIEHAARPEGDTSYTLGKLLALALDTVVAHSNKPLRVSIGFGFFLSGISLCAALYLILRYLVHGIGVEGWTSVMVSIWFVAGLLFANLGVMGLYLGKVFDETKNRPLYVVRDLLGSSAALPEQKPGTPPTTR